MYFLPAFIWGVIIFVLSTSGGINLPESWWDVISVDKVGHLVFYGIFCFLILWGFLKSYHKTPYLGAISGCFLYGLMLEVIQFTFFPFRFFEYFDILANILGILFGAFAFYYYVNK